MQANGTISPQSFVKLMSYPQEIRRSLLENIGREAVSGKLATNSTTKDQEKT